MGPSNFIASNKLLPMTEPEISFNIQTSTLDEKLAALPEAPGVYLHKDSAGKVIYIGKARHLVFCKGIGRGYTFP